jgi:hypothetical protein
MAGSDDPAPPVDVQVIYRDGTAVPVSCVYLGTSPEGERIWLVVDAPPGRLPVGLQVASLPARTTIRLTVLDDDGGDP